MLKPLGLPPGSVRALLLLGLATRAVFDLRFGHPIAGWLAAALLVCAAGYFSARASAAERGEHVTDQPPTRRHPLWLPAGTVRLLFLVIAGYGAYLYIAKAKGLPSDPALAWILGAFAFGVLMRFLLTHAGRPADQGTWWVWHLQAMTVLVAVGGLVAIAALDRSADVATWVEPVLAAGAVYYFATR